MFNDRFTHNNPALANLDIKTATEAQIQTVSPYLWRIVELTRAHSVLTKKKSVAEIYDAITYYADPRIALILAAARDNSGNQLFPDITLVREFMFGITSDVVLIADVRFNEKSIFIQGIERVSSALAAAFLIAQLSQLPEQAKHAQIIEDKAIADLDRILKVPSLVDTQTIQQIAANTIPSLYFENSVVTISSVVTVYCYTTSVGFSTWDLVQTYLPGSLATATVCADISDYINNKSLNTQLSSNIIAAPILSSSQSQHRVEFSSRRRDTELKSEVICVRIDYAQDNQSPFLWGVKETILTKGNLNSLLLAVEKGKYTSVSVIDDNTVSLDVLYIRQNNRVYTQSHNLTLRVSPTMTEPLTISMPYIYLDGDSETCINDRKSQMAILILEMLYNSKVQSKALATIIKNDPIDNEDGLTAIQLVSWTATNPETAIILDLLEFPPDLEVALGTISAPVTAFSCKPRSIKVESKFVSNLSGSTIDLSSADGTVKVVKMKESRLLQKMKDIKYDQELYTQYLNNLI
jgi:hypothetical protein